VTVEVLATESGAAKLPISLEKMLAIVSEGTLSVGTWEIVLGHLLEWVLVEMLEGVFLASSFREELSFEQVWALVAMSAMALVEMLAMVMVGTLVWE
jgi:hypothetical protein